MAFVFLITFKFTSLLYKFPGWLWVLEEAMLRIFVSHGSDELRFWFVTTERLGVSIWLGARVSEG